MRSKMPTRGIVIPLATALQLPAGVMSAGAISGVGGCGRWMIGVIG